MIGLKSEFQGATGADMNDFLDTFIRVFGAAFPIVNPPGMAFLFLALTRSIDRKFRGWLASRIAIYSLVIMLLSIYGGAWVLTFFGVSVPALRVGGGFVLAVTGWRLLNTEPLSETTAPPPTDPAKLESSAFYPLTMPLTTGPGTIAALIALGAGPSVGPMGWTTAALGALAAALVLSGLIFVCYTFADRMESLMGRALSDALMRLFALFLLCIGVEMIWAGLSQLLRSAGIGA